VECKNVPLATTSLMKKGPKKKNSNYPNVIIENDEDGRVAIFPYGSKNAKTQVVSSRAIKHVEELRNEVKKDNVRAAVLFFVSRDDCQSFRAGEECDELFAKVLRRASDGGVKILAVDWKVKDDEIWMGKQLPVKWGPKSQQRWTKEEDQWLEKVLHHEMYGEKRSNWKADKKKREREEKETESKRPKQDKAMKKKQKKQVVIDEEKEEDEEEEDFELLSEESSIEKKSKKKKDTKKRSRR